jgi:hypothetical protein
MHNEEREMIRLLVDALDIAVAGLAWYRDRMPDAKDGSDDEADETIAAALAKARTLLAQPQFDASKPCALTVMRPGQPVSTLCERCHNPRHACDYKPVQPPTDGWVCVPRAPTPGMKAAGAAAGGQGFDLAHHTYSAMLTAAPQPPAREPLSDEQIEDLYFDGFSLSNLREFARAIEAAHGITGDKT